MCLTATLAKLYAVWSCGMLTMWPLILAVACCPELWNVDDVAAHTGRCDEAAISETIQLVLLLLSPYSSRRTGAIEDAIDVDFMTS